MSLTMVTMPSRPAALPRPKSPPDVTHWKPGRLFRISLFARRRGWLVALGSAGFICHQVCESLVPVVVGVVVDQALAPHDGGALLGWLAVLAAVFTVLAFSWRVGMRATMRAYSYGAHDLRQLAVDRVLHPHGMLHRRAPGEVLSIASSDTDRVAGLAWLISWMLAAAAGVVTAAVSLLFISVPLGLSVLIATPVMLVTMHFLSVPLERRSEAEQAATARAGAVATDFVSGLRVLKGLGAEQSAVARYRAASQDSYASALRAVRSKAAYSGVSTALSAAFLACIAFFSSWMALLGQLSVGELVTVVGLAQFVQGPMMSLGFFGVELAQKRGSAKRLGRFLTEPAALDAVTARPSGQAPSSAGPAPGGPVLIPPALEVHPHAAGRPSIPAFTARTGQVVGVVVPDSEDAQHLVEVLGFRSPAPPGWLSAAGEDLAGLDPSAGRSLIFAGEHDAALFTGTVGDNLAGAGAVPDGRAVAASAVADVLGHLDAGLDTVLHNQGRELSGGQRQRLVLGRALHQPQPVIVLHNPTTAVDTVTESLIAAGLRDFPDKALILVTTSPTLLAACHHIVVAGSESDGVGTHHELLDNLAGYRELVES
ncbi:MAG: transporter ATP-binding protein [Pseudarthrobacter sp.]|nr:transporter ATP-binding protein [Pseudarthrobacter sp.]